MVKYSDHENGTLQFHINGLEEIMIYPGVIT